MRVFAPKPFAALLLLFAGLGLSTAAKADTITVGVPNPGATALDTCTNCDYLLAPTFSAAGYELTSYSFAAGQAGDITPLLFNYTVSGGDVTFTLVGVGASHIITTPGDYTFDFGLASGEDVTSSHSVFGFYSDTAVVPFSSFAPSLSLPLGSAGVYFAVPAVGLHGTSTSYYAGGYQQAALGVLSNRDYSIVASATAVAPEPSSLALLGTGLAAVFGSVRRKLKA